MICVKNLFLLRTRQRLYRLLDIIKTRVCTKTLEKAEKTDREDTCLGGRMMGVEDPGAPSWLLLPIKQFNHSHDQLAVSPRNLR